MTDRAKLAEEAKDLTNRYAQQAAMQRATQDDATDSAQTSEAGK